MTDLAHPPVAEQNLHNVESHIHIGKLQHPQVIQGRLSEEPLLAAIDRFGRANPDFVRSRFDFHKDQNFAVPKDEIGFAASMEIGGEELQAEPFQMRAGGPFPQSASPQMFRAAAGFAQRAEPFRELDHG
jgi:hypothetical protein